MSLCVGVDQNGFLHSLSDAPSACSQYLLIDATEYQAMQAPVLTSEDVAYAFSWGFAAVVVTGYFGGYAVGIVRQLLNKL